MQFTKGKCLGTLSRKQYKMEVVLYKSRQGRGKMSSWKLNSGKHCANRHLILRANIQETHSQGTIQNPCYLMPGETFIKDIVQPKAVVLDFRNWRIKFKEVLHHTKVKQGDHKGFKNSEEYECNHLKGLKSFCL